MKTCTGCGELKEPTDFWKSKRTKDGLRQRCKKCTYTQNSNWRTNHKDAWNSYAKTYEERYPERYKELSNATKHRIREKDLTYFAKLMSAYRERNPDKAKARSMVANAVRKGILERPLACPFCASEGMVEAHHPDHSKPLEIVWCCKRCHFRIFHPSRRAGG